jgi:hypothetical protein
MPSSVVIALLWLRCGLRRGNVLAFIVFHDHTSKSVSAEKGLHIWQVLCGDKEPENEQQAEFIAQIERIYLNRKTAPASYLAMYPEPLEIKDSYASTLGVRK